ncbi:hypothetical protein [Crossiella sp. CA198]|uniref:hypothetical protein n=1 Tax=Crossiella sp. CA198 TaxID=3455607 RepID=UPI003F8CF2FC
MNLLNRLSFLTHAVYAAMWSALAPHELAHLEAALANVSADFVDSTVEGEFFRCQLSACTADDGTAGARKPLQSVLNLLSLMERSAREVRSVRRELLSVGARRAEVARWLFRDCRLPRPPSCPVRPGFGSPIPQWPAAPDDSSGSPGEAVRIRAPVAAQLEHDPD